MFRKLNDFVMAEAKGMKGKAKRQKPTLVEFLLRTRHCSKWVSTGPLLNHTTILGRYYHHSHSTGKEMEAQRGWEVAHSHVTYQWSTQEVKSGCLGS